MRKPFSILILALACVLWTGCKLSSLTDPIIGPSYKPANIYVKPGAWETGIHRVAILPLAYQETLPDAVSGRDNLEPLLRTELAKAQRFECVSVTPAALKKWTNREKWSAADLLPGDMIQTLKTEVGCDAVLFAELTQYRPYAPIVIGWNLKLVSVSSQDILWSVDETFDASQPSMANAARRYQQQRQSPNPVLDDSRQVLISPRRFGQFTIETLVGTLPGKQFPTAESAKTGSAAKGTSNTNNVPSTSYPVLNKQ